MKIIINHSPHKHVVCFKSTWLYDGDHHQYRCPLASCEGRNLHCICVSPRDAHSCWQTNSLLALTDSMVSMMWPDWMAVCSVSLWVLDLTRLKEITRWLRGGKVSAQARMSQRLCKVYRCRYTMNALVTITWSSGFLSYLYPCPSL